MTAWAMLALGLGLSSLVFALPTGFQSVQGSAKCLPAENGLLVKAKGSSILWVVNKDPHVS